MKTDGFQQVHGLGKILFRFSGETNDHVGADGDVRTNGTQLVNFFQVEFSGVLAMHAPEDLVGTRLRRQVKMGADCIEIPECSVNFSLKL